MVPESVMLRVVRRGGLLSKDSAIRACLQIAHSESLATERVDFAWVAHVVSVKYAICAGVRFRCQQLAVARVF